MVLRVIMWIIRSWMQWMSCAQWSSVVLGQKTQTVHCVEVLSSAALILATLSTATQPHPTFYLCCQGCLLSLRFPIHFGPHRLWRCSLQYVFLSKILIVRFICHIQHSDNNVSLIGQSYIFLANFHRKYESGVMTKLRGGTTLETQVTLVWIPGHLGICENELVDRISKAALKLPLCIGNVPPRDQLERLASTSVAAFGLTLKTSSWGFSRTPRSHGVLLSAWAVE